MISEVCLVGRNGELSRVVEDIRRTRNVLIKGRAGIGKSAVLISVALQIESDERFVVIRLPCVATRQAMVGVAEQLHNAVGLTIDVGSLPPRIATKARLGQVISWDDIRRTVSRATVDDTVSMVVRTMRKHRCLIVVDSLEVPPTFVDVLEKLLQCAQCIAAIDESNRRNRVVKLLWQFQTTIELQPLGLADSEKLIEQYCEKYPPRFADDKTRKLFMRHVAHQGEGVPAAIISMLDDARAEDRITPAMVRGYSSEAAVRYMDMTPALILVLIGFMAMKYVGRGIGEVELVVLSGVSTALLMGIRYFIFSMRA